MLKSTTETERGGLEALVSAPKFEKRLRGSYGKIKNKKKK
jgi:hypothetical protein